MHGNSSCRLEAFDLVRILLPANITLFCFDFVGCGKSDGEYISLGWHERDDVNIIVNYLRSDRFVSTVGLWGRSMGAVTALLHGDRDPSIAALILDSPFSSMKTLVKELA
jgi:alpha/beta superfamily hydrolase